MLLVVASEVIKVLGGDLTVLLETRKFSVQTVVAGLMRKQVVPVDTSIQAARQTADVSFTTIPRLSTIQVNLKTIDTSTMTF